MDQAKAPDSHELSKPRRTFAWILMTVGLLLVWSQIRWLSRPVPDHVTRDLADYTNTAIMASIALLAASDLVRQKRLQFVLGVLCAACIATGFVGLYLTMHRG